METDFYCSPVATNKEHTLILKSWASQVIPELRNHLSDVLNSTHLEWQAKLDRASNLGEQNIYTDAEQQLNADKDKILNHFSLLLTQGVEDFPNPEHIKLIQDNHQQFQSSFELVTEDRYEHDIALENMVGQVLINNDPALHALSQRLALVNNGNPVKTEDFPISPQLVTENFAQVIRILGIEKSLLPPLYNLFNSQILSRLGSYYEKLNALFVAAGILPNLQYRINQHENYQTPYWLKQSKNRADKKELFTEHQDNADDVKPEVIDEVEVEEIHITAPEIKPRENPISKDSIPQFDSIDNIKATLSKQRQQIFDRIGNKNITPQQKNTLTRVGIIFDDILADKYLPNVSKVLLSRSHLPFTLYALRNSNFFSQQDDPFRQLFNTMIDSCRIWIGGTTLDKGIFPVIKKLVDDLSKTSKISSAHIDQAHHSLLDSLNKLSKKSFVSEQKTIEIEKGKARLEYAKKQGRQINQKIFHGKLVTTQGAQFIQSCWMDYLTLLLLRHDKLYSVENTRIAESVGKLLLETDQKAASGTLEPKDLQLLDSHLQQEIGALIPHHETAIKKYVAALQGTKFETSQMEFNSAEAETGNKSHNPDSQLTAKLSSLPVGAYLLFIDNDDTKIMTKFSWMNELTEEMLFVDHTGRRHSVLSIAELASKIDRGKILFYKTKHRKFLDIQ